MHKRIDNGTPQIIIDLFQFPYFQFGNQYGANNLILLDIACGNGLQTPFLKSKFKHVISMDIDPQNVDVIQASITDIPLENKMVDVSFSFETIEHINQDHQHKAIQELIRVTKDIIIIGSVNETGVDFIDGHEIYKAINDKNSYHICELNHDTFPSLVNNYKDRLDISYYQTVYEDKLMIHPGLQSHAYVNYAVCKLKV